VRSQEWYHHCHAYSHRFSWGLGHTERYPAYAAIIAGCVEKSGGVTRLTFNVSDFECLARPGLEVVVPGTT
jgi:hypothetical protein